MYWSNQIGGTSWVSYIDDQIGKLRTAFTEKNIPVFIGETSVNYPAGNFDRNPVYADSSICVDYVLRTLLINGFVPVIWDTNDNFYSRTKYRIKSGADRKVIRQIYNETHGITGAGTTEYSDVED